MGPLSLQRARVNAPKLTLDAGDNTLEEAFQIVRPGASSRELHLAL